MNASIRPRYVERPPAPALAHWIECFWSVRDTHAPGEVSQQIILPDGCMDVIFDLAPASGAEDPGFAVGTMTRPLTVPSAGTVHLIGVRFRPGGATPFLDVPAYELVDRRAPLEALWGAQAARALEHVHEQGASALEALLEARLRGARRDDPSVRRAAALLDGPGSVVGVDRLADQLRMGRRQLERRFRDVVGVAPGTLSRILRFRRTVALLRDRPERSLSWVAAEAGYHDQPHMTRDFRELAGATPGDYRKRPRIQSRSDAARGAAGVASVQDGPRGSV